MKASTLTVDMANCWRSASLSPVKVGIAVSKRRTASRLAPNAA